MPGGRGCIPHFPVDQDDNVKAEKCSARSANWSEPGGLQTRCWLDDEPTVRSSAAARTNPPTLIGAPTNSTGSGALLAEDLDVAFD